MDTTVLKSKASDDMRTRATILVVLTPKAGKT